MTGAVLQKVKMQKEKVKKEFRHSPCKSTAHDDFEN